MTTEQTGRDAAIRLIAENQLRRYDSEFDADHLSWVDFEPSAREDIDALAAAGLLRAAPDPDPTAPEGRDVYVHIGRGGVVSTKEVSEFVYVDLDAAGGPVGVEILGAIGADADGKPVVLASEPSGDVGEAVARVLYDTANRDIGDSDPWEECGYRDVYRGLARAAIAAMPQQDLVEQYRHLLGCIWLYVDWRRVTRQLETVQKELWADAVDVFGDPADRGPKAPRWWRDDYADGEQHG